MEARVGVDGGSATREFLQCHHSRAPTPQPPPKPQQQPIPQIGTVQQLLAGGIAGAFSKTCTAPLARLTILFQVQGMHSDVAVMSKPCIWREAIRIVNEEGFRAFWKGNLVTIAHRLPYTSVNFYAYEQYKSILKSIPGLDKRGENASSDIFVHFVGGGLAGITAASATYPLDLVRTRLAAQRNAIYYQGIRHALHTICRDEGFFGLYKGMGATLLESFCIFIIFFKLTYNCLFQDALWQFHISTLICFSFLLQGVGPSIAISFSVYESLRSHWHSLRPDDSTILVSLACGSLSGIASSTATFPLDLVRRRKQLEGVAGRARVYNTGLFGIFRQIIRTEGLRGLYRGIMPEYYKVVPSVGIVFMTYETLKKLLSHAPFS